MVEKVKDNDQYNSLVDENQELREQKVKLTEEQALFTRNEECIAALRKELEASKGDALAYDDKLVRDFIEKIEVFPEMMRFTMKTGMVTEVAM